MKTIALEATDIDTNNNINDQVVIGRNAVIELIKSGREIEHVLVAKGEREGSVHQILALCREKRIVVKNVDKRKLDALSPFGNHQGVAASVPAHEYSSIDEILEYAQEKGEHPFLLICDEIEDSHNLGAIIRTAEACGAHGIVIPQRRNVGLNYVVAKTSCGALEHMRVARVVNLGQTIDSLKKKNIWIYGADMDGASWCETDFDGGVALVVGSEGSGLSRLIKEKCDFIVSLPMCGKVNSLNVSVAAGVIMYEVARQRLK